ncbi:Uncharacterized protein APZ42_014416 [Daphnia magna]|uniref:Uncharacterized protein n=1 Tax=Daphnia magna TaxID=35525 RepID=A0A162PWU1_9CRUS|nr:Uncharacterized protein APZ42_014416 [Daphnia magna]
MSSHVSKIKRMLASKGDHHQCKRNGLEYHRSFYTLWPLIISSNTCLRLARSPVLASPVAPSSLRPSPRLRFASPVAPSSLRPSPRLRFARRPVFSSPVDPSSLRPSPRLLFARQPIFASPVVSSTLLGHPLFTSSPRLCGIFVFCNV